MLRIRELLSGRLMLIASLFAIGTVHALIFSVFEFPSNFLLGQSESYGFYFKIVFYTFVIGISLSHQAICRTFGLKKALMAGLFFNGFGLITLWINKEIGGLLPLIFLDMVFFGVALSSVINALITYVVIELPEKIRMGIIVLFAALNAGVMLGPLVIDAFQDISYQNGIYLFLLLLLALATGFVSKFFFEPVYPSHLSHLRKGTLIWKELHYRLGLFFIAIICYALTENTFSLWGFVKVAAHLGQSAAGEIVSLFWLFLIIGQLVLLIPLYFFRASGILYILVSILIVDLFFLARQTDLEGYILALVIGGFGCSVIFPILLSMIENELARCAQKDHILPYIETSVSIMLAGYFIGIATIDLWVNRLGETVDPQRIHYYLAMAFIAITGVIALFLNLTAPNRR